LDAIVLGQRRRLAAGSWIVPRLQRRESPRVSPRDIQSPARLTERAVKTEYQDLDPVLVARAFLPVCYPSVSPVSLS